MVGVTDGDKSRCSTVTGSIPSASGASTRRRRSKRSARAKEFVGDLAYALDVIQSWSPAIGRVASPVRGHFRMAPAQMSCQAVLLLSMEFIRTAAQVNRLETPKTRAVMADEEFQLDPELRAARERREMAGDALLAHALGHRCTTPA